MPEEYNTLHTPSSPEYSLGGRTHTAVEDTGNWKGYINNMVMAAWDKDHSSAGCWYLTIGCMSICS